MLLLDVLSEIRFVTADSTCLPVAILYSLWLVFKFWSFVGPLDVCRSSVLSLFLMLNSCAIFSVFSEAPFYI